MWAIKKNALTVLCVFLFVLFTTRVLIASFPGGGGGIATQRGGSYMVSDGGPGWLGTWAKRIKITIPSTNIDATLTDYPVKIHLSTSSGIGADDVSAVFDELTSDANRKKIAITGPDGVTEQYVEIEFWDDVNETATLHTKVASVSSSASTFLYLYYDSSEAANTSYVGDTTDAVSHNVWDSDFKAIYHLAQDPDGDAADAIKDSTTTAHELTPQGTMVTADLVTSGSGGLAIVFDSNDRLGGADHADWDWGSGDFTVEAFFYNPAGGAQRVAVGYDGGAWAWNDTTGIGWLFVLEGDEDLNYYWDSGAGGSNSTLRTTNPVSDDAWHYGAIRRDGADLFWWVDAAIENGGAVAVDFAGHSGTQYFSVSATKSSVGFFQGTISEVRISKGVGRTDAWCKATNYTLKDALISEFGAEETP